MLELLNEYKTEEPVVLGKVIDCCAWDRELLYLSGGAGMAFNRPAFEKVCEFFSFKESKDKINAFHNVCSHRCLKLVEKEKNVGQIISCPYHAWSYDLKGNLVSSPHFGGTNNHEPKNFLRKKIYDKLFNYYYFDIPRYILSTRFDLNL